MRVLATRFVALAASAAVVVALAACTAKSSPSAPYVAPQGVSDSEIVFGTHQPLTGAAAAGYSKISAATKAYFDYVNSKGGVYNRKITYKIEDDAYDPAKTQTVVRKLVEQDKVFAILNGLGTATHLSVMDYLRDKQIPDLFVSSGATSWNQPSRYPGTFAYQPDYTTEGKILGNYVRNNLSGKKVCSFAQDDAFGRDSVSGVEAGLGTAVAAKQTYITSNSNVSPQMQTLKDSGCEVVMLTTIPTFTALALGTAAKLNYAPQFVVTTVGGDYTTLAGLLGDLGKPLLNNLISFGYIPAASNANDPWVKTFMQINKDFNGNAPFDLNVMYGMSVAYLVVQVLQKAGHNITVDSLIGTIESGGFRGPGLTPFLYSGTSHAGLSGGRLNKVTNGVQEYFGPAYVTDAGTGPITEYTEPQPTPPADGLPTP